MFYIQASTPALQRPAQKSYLSVGQALRDCVQPITEEMFWIWSGVPLAVGYGEPFATVYRNALGIVEACLTKDSADGTYGFHEGVLDTQWHMTWSNGVLRIDSTWFRAPGGLEAVLTERASIEMPLEAFVAEWKMPFRRVLDALDGSGVVIEGDDTEVLARLRAAEAAIPRAGWLYRGGA